ncbi:hypothetical protein E2C01_077998 [Portunus trituberculatus]|uniref:Uncharacterized protein n=1 Tax=Portunus trituberculatus TaxID=210409 RepID=A0A5B7ICU3_PORTR|nr:hypothetical protein [Portunus trituberculatus]
MCPSWVAVTAACGRGGASQFEVSSAVPSALGTPRPPCRAPRLQPRTPGKLRTLTNCGDTKQPNKEQNNTCPSFPSSPITAVRHRCTSLLLVSMIHRTRMNWSGVAIAPSPPFPPSSTEP